MTRNFLPLYLPGLLNRSTIKAMADDLHVLKDDMNAFILGHGMQQFRAYVTEDMQSVMWDSGDNIDAWKDFVELAKASGVSPGFGIHALPLGSFTAGGAATLGAPPPRRSYQNDIEGKALRPARQRAANEPRPVGRNAHLGPKQHPGEHS